MIPRMSPAKARLLDLLKRSGPLTTDQLAEATEVTPAAVRQHLGELVSGDLVTYVERRGQVGRPARRWQLVDSDVVNSLFPDGHAELAVSLLRAANVALGDGALDKMLDARTSQQMVAYLEGVPENADLAARVEILSDIRTREGYMAEWGAVDGTFRLVENHCPVSVAAAEYPALCASDLDLFRSFFGPDVRVERDAYALAGHQRCGYTIAPRTDRAAYD